MTPVRELQQFYTKIIEPYGLSWQMHVASLDPSGPGVHASDLIDLGPEGNGVGYSLLLAKILD